MKNLKLCLLFFITGLVQMGIARFFNLHKGLEHMVFTYWWEYAIEAFLYSLCHAGIYFWVQNNK